MAPEIRLLEEKELKILKAQKANKNILFGIELTGKPESQYYASQHLVFSHAKENLLEIRHKIINKKGEAYKVKYIYPDGKLTSEPILQEPQISQDQKVWKNATTTDIFNPYMEDQIMKATNIIHNMLIKAQLAERKRKIQDVLDELMGLKAIEPIPTTEKPKLTIFRDPTRDYTKPPIPTIDKKDFDEVMQGFMEEGSKKVSRKKEKD